MDNGGLQWDSIVPALLSGGFGAALAAVGTALIQTMGKRQESRASAADLITNAAGTLAGRQGETITRLEKRVERQAKAIMALTSVLDELLPQIPLPDEEREKVARVMLGAKLAV